MAEIKIEKKKPVWPWILLGVLIIALLIWFIGRDDDEDQEEIMEDVTEQVDTTDQIDNDKSDSPEALEMYTDYIRKGEDKMGLDHEYTHQAFTHLIKALEETAEANNYDLQQDLDSVNVKIDRIQRDPMSLNHANLIKDGFQSISNVFTNMQQAKFPDLDGEVAQLQQYANNLNVNKKTLEQKNIVKGFFDEAEQLLTEMNQ